MSGQRGHSLLFYVRIDRILRCLRQPIRLVVREHHENQEARAARNGGIPQQIIGTSFQVVDHPRGDCAASATRRTRLAGRDSHGAGLCQSPPKFAPIPRRQDLSAWWARRQCVHGGRLPRPGFASWSNGEASCGCGPRAVGPRDWQASCRRADRGSRPGGTSGRDDAILQKADDSVPGKVGDRRWIRWSAEPDAAAP
jgi:hypothetical protein